MSERIVPDTVVVKRRIWGLIPIGRPQLVWRIVSAFTGELEPNWHETREAAEEALIESRKSEAAVLLVVVDALPPRERLSPDQCLELTPLALANDGVGFRETALRILGEDAMPILNGLQREKVYEDTAVAVAGRQEVERWRRSCSG